MKAFRNSPLNRCELAQAAVDGHKHDAVAFCREMSVTCGHSWPTRPFPMYVMSLELYRKRVLRTFGSIYAPCVQYRKGREGVRDNSRGNTSKSRRRTSCVVRASLFPSLIYEYNFGPCSPKLLSPEVCAERVGVENFSLSWEKIITDANDLPCFQEKWGKPWV